MRHRSRMLLLSVLVLSLPLLGGALPADADLPPPLDAIVSDLLPGRPTSHPTAVQVSAGWAHTCAVTGAGDALCWGSNANGQLGNGNNINSSTPVRVATDSGLSPATVADIGAGEHHTCAVTLGHEMYCWGDNTYGQLGTGTPTNHASPVSVTSGAGLTAGTVARITTGAYHSCATATNGDAYCWGYNGYGQVGDGSVTNRTAPVKVAAGAGLTPGTVESLSAGLYHTCGRTTNGDAYCWGYNGERQLGNGTSTSSTTPVQVSTATGLASGSAASLAGGGYHTCANTTTGTAYCWGSNNYGQLGDGTTTARNQPTQVAYGTVSIANTTSLDAGLYHTCATVLTGDAYCWGSNTSGQLGNGNGSYSNAPTKVALNPYVPPGHCDDPSTRVDKVEWSNGANSFSVDIHEKDDGYVYTCVHAERNGEVLVDEVVRVKGEVVTVDEDAPPGNGPDSPCTENHGEGGTSTNRAYVRSTPSESWPAAVCAGIESGAGNRHVRILIG